MNVKQKVTIRLHKFIQYWKARETKQQPGIHETVYVMADARIEAGVKIGRYSYIRNHAEIDSGTIGAFCSIAPGVKIGADEHPLDAVSTHPFWFSPGGFTLPTDDTHVGWSQPKPPPAIGNDVWIGAGAQILRGSVIEDGAIIGAGAIVNGRVPAYGIAVGIPARTIRHRFEPELCEKLRESRWWDWDEESIRRMRPHFNDPQRFIEILELDEGSEVNNRETIKMSHA